MLAINQLMLKQPVDFFLIDSLLKGLAWHFKKYDYLLSCGELDEGIDSTLMSVCEIGSYHQQLVRLA